MNNKLVIIIVGVVAIAGVIFALTGTKPPTTSSNALDRIEAAIEAKLKGI